MTAMTLELEGFEKQRIEVRPAGLFSSRKLLVNGEPAPKGAKRGEMTLTRDDGQQVTAQWRSGFGSNILEVDGETIKVETGAALKSYEWVLMLSPAALAVFGIMGWIFAALAIGIGYAVFRTEKSPGKKMAMWLGGLVFAFLLNFLFGVALAFIL